MYTSREEAFRAFAERNGRTWRRARAELPMTPDSSALARALVRHWLTAWGLEELTTTATTVVSVFVDNVLEHTDGALSLIVESSGDTSTIAVEDHSQVPVSRHEDGCWGAEAVHGLSLVAALCRAWGSMPTPSGKTVWAVVGAESAL